MNWNRLERTIAQHGWTAGNYFRIHSGTAFNRFDVALGRKNDRSPLRFNRDDKGNKTGDGISYQELLNDDRKYCEGLFRMTANRLGVPISIVVHGVLTGREDRFIAAALKWLQGSVRERKGKMPDGTPIVGYYLDPSRIGGYVEHTAWKDVEPTKIDAEEVEKAIKTAWSVACNTRTEFEKALEGAEGDKIKVGAALAAEKVRQSKIKGNASKGMKGVQVVNAKQAAINKKRDQRSSHAPVKTKAPVA